MVICTEWCFSQHCIMLTFRICLKVLTAVVTCGSELFVPPHSFSYSAQNRPNHRGQSHRPLRPAARRRSHLGGQRALHHRALPQRHRPADQRSGQRRHPHCGSRGRWAPRGDYSRLFVTVIIFIQCDFKLYYLRGGIFSQAITAINHAHNKNIWIF